MEISVRLTNIEPKHVKILISNGIVLVSHLNAFTSTKLAKKTRLSLDECEQILSAIKPKRPHYIMKASELMISKPFDKLSTSIEYLDVSLGGGIRCGQITEISGEAGVGKSNLAAQIATLVMLPKKDNGFDGSVLLVHTEGEGKLKLTVKRYSILARAADYDQLTKKKLHVVECTNEFQLLEIVNRLRNIIEERPSVKLIIIDSITCAFLGTDKEKLDHIFYNKRSRRLTSIVKKLAHLAWDKRIAVIVTNHVTYNPGLGETKPCMGKLWSHMCQTKIYLERRGTRYDVARFAHVTKGAINTPSIAQFRISDKIQN